jgi:hypothetical protein
LFSRIQTRRAAVVNKSNHNSTITQLLGILSCLKSSWLRRKGINSIAFLSRLSTRSRQADLTALLYLCSKSIARCVMLAKTGLCSKGLSRRMPITFCGDLNGHPLRVPQSSPRNLSGRDICTCRLESYPVLKVTLRSYNKPIGQMDTTTDSNAS